MEQKKVECQFCHLRFVPKGRKKKDYEKIKFCSRKCHYQSRLKYRICQNCGNKFHVILSEVDKGRALYCSVRCRCEGAKKRVSIICHHCGKVFFRQNHLLKHARIHYCSRDCFIKHTSKNDWHCRNCGLGLEEAIKKNTKDRRSYREKRTSGRYYFCNRQCYSDYVAKNKLKTQCYVCKIELRLPKSKMKEYNFCSREHMHIWRIERRPAWAIKLPG